MSQLAERRNVDPRPARAGHLLTRLANFHRDDIPTFASKGVFGHGATRETGADSNRVDACVTCNLLLEKKMRNAAAAKSSEHS
jgi:hypothetical protein